MKLLKNQGAIHKVVIMPTTGEQTIFQGFDTGVINPEVAEILLLISKAPKEINEIFAYENEVIHDTLNSENPILLISKENIKNIPEYYHFPFCLIFCVADDFSYVKNFTKNFDVPPIICCNTKLADVRCGEVSSIYSFDKTLYSRFKFVEKMIRKNTGERKISVNLKRRSTSFESSRWNSTLNNTTLPNELLIESLGFMLSRPKKIKRGSSKREFINIILDSVDAYNECLSKLGKEASPEVLLYAPGMYSFLYEKNSEFYKIITKDLNLDEKRFLINGVLRNPNYSGIRISFELEESTINKFLKNPALRYLISLRRSEMRLTTAAITLLSLNKKIPAIRMPNSINHYGYYLKNLENLALELGIHSLAFINKSKAFNTVIKRALGYKFRSYIAENYSNISFVCDVPLDWVRFNDIPIMFSHEISRINSTPGNILLQHSSSFPRVVVKATELKKVLVIRSFEPDDHLKFLLEKSIDIFKRNMPDLDCEIVDVRTKIELVDALNQYEGYLLVMDCHGDHGGDKSNGWLIIGDEKVDTWGLRKIARVPPIVILSACLTSALSGSHASVANGFIISGALSVIGTLLPVNAIDSAVFVSRLIYRFYQFPSAIPKEFSHVNVRLLLSIFLRMSYVTDLMRGFEREGLMPKDSWEEDAIAINTYINMLNDDWYDYTLRILVRLTGLTAKGVTDFIYKKLYITETMCYSQIGFPDSITINLKE